MTIKDIIDTLILSGVPLKFRKRSDGGYLITELNGVKFTGAKGNALARQMTNQHLSVKRQVQTSRNVAKYIKKPSIDKAIKNAIKRTQRSFKKSMQLKNQTARVSTRRVRKLLAQFGEKETLKKLKELENYSKGYAYIANVEALKERLQRLYINYGNYQLEINEIIYLIDSNKDKFPDRYITAIYSTTYELEKGTISFETWYNSVLSIIQ